MAFLGGVAGDGGALGAGGLTDGHSAAAAAAGWQRWDGSAREKVADHHDGQLEMEGGIL